MTFFAFFCVDFAIIIISFSFSIFPFHVYIAFTGKVFMHATIFLFNSVVAILFASFSSLHEI